MHNMTIFQLECMLAVANLGSFTAAAKQCFITQPSLSVQIQTLENELGMVLFDRTTKPVKPTEAGEMIIEQARKTVAAFKTTRDTADSIKNGLSGKLKLGIIPSLSPYLLPLLIPEFAIRYPNVELEVCDIAPVDIKEALSQISVSSPPTATRRKVSVKRNSLSTGSMSMSPGRTNSATIK